MKVYYWRPILSRSPDFVQMHTKYLINTSNIFTKNFGDEIGKFVLSSVIGSENFYWSSPSRAQLFPIGSVAENILSAKSTITANLWGIGFRSSDFNMNSVQREYNVIALRGSLSVENLKISGNNNVLGDPALLISKFYKSNYTEQKEAIDFLLIQHFQLMQRLPKNFLIHDSNKLTFKIMFVHQSLSTIIDSIISSKIVFSSALHPLIVADAYGIPGVRISSSEDKIDSFKFKDYLSVYPCKTNWPTITLNEILNRDFDIKKIEDKSREHLIKIKQSIPLIQSKLLDSLISWYSLNKDS